MGVEFIARHVGEQKICGIGDVTIADDVDSGIAHLEDRRSVGLRDGTIRRVLLHDG